MPPRPLTDAVCRQAKPGPKPYKIADGANMYLVVMPSGAKYWRYRYRYGGRPKQLALGVYMPPGAPRGAAPQVSLAAAREALAAARALLARGIDPSAERKAAKTRARMAAKNSFEAVATDWLARHARRVSEAHIANCRARLEADVFPEIGYRPIASLEAPDLLAVARRIEARHAYDMAHRVIQICGQVFSYAISAGLAARNPASDLRGALTPHTRKKMPRVDLAELPRLLAALEGYEGRPETVLGLRLLPLTFLRPGELSGALWEEVDLEAALWTIPAARMKMRRPHLVPLSRQAVAILTSLRGLTGWSRWLFPGRDPEKPISKNTFLYALYRLGYHGRHSAHGFRHVASTILNGAKRPDHSRMWTKDAVERQLAHKEKNKVQETYDEADHLPERVAMMQWYGDSLDAMRAKA